MGTEICLCPCRIFKYSSESHEKTTFSSNIHDFHNTIISKEDRVKLQNGHMAIAFSDDKLTTFFKKDLKVNKAKNLNV